MRCRIISRITTKPLNAQTGFCGSGAEKHLAQRRAPLAYDESGNCQRRLCDKIIRISDHHKFIFEDHLGRSEVTEGEDRTRRCTWVRINEFSRLRAPPRGSTTFTRSECSMLVFTIDRSALFSQLLVPVWKVPQTYHGTVF
jgi:hypothetical protein